MSHQLVIDIPDEIEIYDSTEAQQALAVSWYHSGRINMKQAISLIGGNRRAFEEAMMENGFPMMDENEIQIEKDAASHYPS